MVIAAALIPADVQSQPRPSESRPNAAPFLNGTLPEAAPPPAWRAVVAFPHLLFTNAVGLTPVPGTANLLCVWEREGRIWTFTNAAESRLKHLVADLSQQCQGWDDCGLLGLAFHPDFATNHYVFVYYPWAAPGQILGSPTNRPPPATPVQNRLSRLTLDENQTVISNSELVLIDQYSPGIWHLGGGLMFNPKDGFLYLAIGDNNDLENNQRLDRGLFSGILRLDVDRIGGNVSHAIRHQPVRGVTANYFIPNDNPFVGQPGVLEEFFALGLRSPYRITCDPGSGRVFIADVGAQLREEIDVIEPGDPPGLNFQWNRIEGSQGDLIPPYIGVNKRPLLDYTHVDGQAVIGGYVYRGRAFSSELEGKYIFGDNVQRKIWVLNESGSAVSKTLLCSIPKGDGPSPGPDYTGLSSFGLDQADEIYMCQLSSIGGRVYKLAHAPKEPGGRPFPPLLSQTGVFAGSTKGVVGATLIPYEVNAPLWSDGAMKQRWMALPANTYVRFSPTGEWAFPAGTVFVKSFELPVDDANPSVRKRLETRLLVRDTNRGVYGITYKWREDNSDADLLTNACSETISNAVPPIGAFSGADIGRPEFRGATRAENDKVEITGGGGEIGNTSDRFHFAWQKRTGDFDIQTRIEWNPASGMGARTGFMARESLDPASRHVFAVMFPCSDDGKIPGFGCELEYRADNGGQTAKVNRPMAENLAAAKSVWLRLKRAGNRFSAFSSADAIHWALIGSQWLTLPREIYFGMTAVARESKGEITAVFHFPEQRLQTWYYPGSEDCLSCHTRAAGYVLGVNTRQLNRDSYDGGSDLSDNQLKVWNEHGLFENPFHESDLKSFNRLVSVSNETAPLEARARSYFDANCGQCHRPQGVATLWDARFETPLAGQRIISGDVYFDRGISGAKVVVPQDLSRSILYQRMSSAGAIKMPPLSKNTIDEEAVAVVAEWISGLAPPQASQRER